MSAHNIITTTSGGDGSTPELLVRHVSEPLAAQLLEGTIQARIWGKSLDGANPATWALAVRVVSRDGKEERGVLLPVTTGGTQKLGTKLAPVLIGPLTLNPISTLKGDRLLAEIGALGHAQLQIRGDKQAWLRLFTDLCYENLSKHLNEPRSSRDINKCIYCGSLSEGLSREHIIPAGLNGELTLTAASCAACGNITSAFELEILRNAVGALRQALEMKSRRPKARATYLPMEVRRRGIQVEIQVPVNEYPNVLALPVFAPPGCVVGRPDSENLNIAQIRMTRLSGLPFHELQRKYAIDADYLGTTIAHHPFSFARLMAKIAYGFAVLRLGMANIAEPYVLPIILGQDKRVGRWIGCDETQPSNRSRGLHEISLRIEGGEIHVFIRLFAQFGAPQYHVVVGKIPT